MTSHREPIDQYDYIDTEYMDNNSDKYEVIIGRFLIDFSYLEHELNRLISEIINERTDAVGYIVTTKMSMLNKIDLLERFVNLEKFYGLKRPRRIVLLIPKLKSINSFRNDIAHANWSSTRPDGMTRVKVKVDKTNGVWFENRNMSLSVLETKHKELLKLIEEVDNIELEE